MKILKHLCVLAALMFASSLAFAQTATITGVVTDSSGAVIPAAVVKVTNTETNAERTIPADARGNYVATPLPVGKYRVEVDQQGFQKAVASDITLQTNETVRVDMKLTPGAVTQTVEVTGAASIVQSETATVGNVIDQQKVDNLPLNGRHFESMSLLVPGVTSTSPSPSNGGQVSISAGGGRFSSNNFRLDGTNNVAEGGGTGISLRPIVDAIQEFKIQTNSYSAEFGRGGGANIEVVTKSGTNAFHANAWDFLRNDALDAKGYFDLQKQTFHRNQFGGTIGGPVVKDKTFFFFAYEGIRRYLASSTLIAVPTLAQRSGLFTTAIRDPLTGVAFQGNQIPAGQITNAAKLIQAYFPQPTPGLVGANNYLSRTPQTNNEDQFNIRIDHRISDSNTLFGRIATNKVNNMNPCNGAGTACVPGFPTSVIGRNTQFTIADTHIFNAQLVNVVRAAVTRTTQTQVTVDSSLINGVNVGASLGIPGFPSSKNPIDYGMQNIAITGFAGFNSQDYNPSFQTFYSMNDTLTYVKGSHNIRTGLEIAQQLFYAQIGRARDALTFGGAAPVSGNSYADFLLGYISQSVQFPTDFVRYRYSYTYGVFAQDDWKVRNNLTLNFGARWDYQTPDKEKQDRASDINPYTGQVQIAGVNGASRSLFEGDKKNFAPRVGFAYRPGQGLVVRGGYGIFYDISLQGAQFGQIRVSPPFFTSQTFNAVANNPGFLTVANPFPSGGTPSLNYTSIQPDYKTGYVQQWNFGVQRSIKSSMVVEVGYIGSKGTHLYENLDVNQAYLGAGTPQSRRPFAAFGTDVTLLSQANSSYNALIWRFERRFSGGMTFLAAYTWSHSLDSFSNSNPNGQSAQNAHDTSTEHANSDFDTRQRLALTYIYQLPFGTGKRFMSHAPSVVNAVFGGWQVSGLSQFQSGNPVNVIIQGASRSNTGTTNLDRPNATGISPLLNGDDKRFFLNPLAYSLQAANTFGNAGRNSAVGPRFISTDISLSKRFSVREKWAAEFRGELFNMFNHPIFAQPSNAFGTPTFGQITNTRGDNRQIQLGLKISR